MPSTNIIKHLYRPDPAIFTFNITRAAKYIFLGRFRRFSDSETRIRIILQLDTL